jgi:ArsR family transcriptional regulator
MEKAANLLKALGDETRMKIVQCLLNGEMCACAIVPSVGKAQPTVSQHLRILVQAGALESRRAGTNILYKIKSSETRRIFQILGIKKIKVNSSRC